MGHNHNDDDDDDNSKESKTWCSWTWRGWSLLELKLTKWIQVGGKVTSRCQRTRLCNGDDDDDDDGGHNDDSIIMIEDYVHKLKF